MKSIMKISLVLLLGSLAFTLGCDRCVHQSRLGYYSDSGAINAGACGYGSYASKLYSSNPAAAVSSIYKNGVGCGACYQIRCKTPSLCTEKGAKIVVADLTQGDKTDFVVTSPTFSSLAFPGKGSTLVKQRIVDAEYARVPCDYGKETLKVKVLSISQYPFYLAVQFLKQGGQTDLVAVDTAKVDSSDWHLLSRKYGSVWDIHNPPSGDLQFRFVVTGGYDGKWVWARNTVRPLEWKAGMVYDLGIQISDIAQEACYPCNNTIWSP